MVRSQLVKLFSVSYLPQLRQIYSDLAPPKDYAFQDKGVIRVVSVLVPGIVQRVSHSSIFTYTSIHIVTGGPHPVVYRP